MIFALAGNQNSGKTTLFNQLTGSKQHVGNFPGVTVEKKEGLIRNHTQAMVVDLPGTYSLSPYTAEEIVTRDFLIKSKPNGIINIVDATNIERNFYFSLQLIELGIPMVIALNMMDEVRESGGAILVDELEKLLGVPIIPISASKNQGVEELVTRAIDTAAGKIIPKRQDFCLKGLGPKGAVHRAIHAISHIIEDHAENADIPIRFAATKLVEGDKPTLLALNLTPNEIDVIEHSVSEMTYELETDREAALADMRYTFIEQICKNTVKKPRVSKARQRSESIDRWLTHKYLAIPIFIGIMITIFWLTFGVVGAFLSSLLGNGIDWLTEIVRSALESYGTNPVVTSLVVDGAIAGVGSVLSFLPTIVVLFFFLSILEDTGYMARVAFVMDKLLRKIGLSGKSFVPMLIGFGCSVPAVLATRTLQSKRDRRMTILLIPFMSCSAKLPIYAVFTAAFFPNQAAIVMIGLYLGGMLLSVCCGLLLKNTVFAGKPVPFVMELPNYRFPAPKNVLSLLWEKAKDFMIKAFTVIFLASLAIWFLQTFDTRLNVVSDSSQSLLALVGRWIAPIFTPLGFNDWRAATAIVTGFSAKEAVVSTLSVLLSEQSLSTIFTPLAALSFLIFNLLYTPCIATVQAVRRETSTRFSIFLMFFQTGLAWVVSAVFYNVARIFI